MTDIIIAANDQDRKMWGTLPDILQRNFPTVSTQGDRGSNIFGEAKFVICSGANAAKAQSDSAVIIFKDADWIPEEIPFRQNAVAVVDSGNPALMAQVSATKLPAITCGLSPRDTVTLTSFSEDSAVLGLQRSVNCFDGTVAEPQEIPLKLATPIDSFTLMATSSVFILSGNIARLKHAIF